MSIVAGDIIKIKYSNEYYLIEKVFETDGIVMLLNIGGPDPSFTYSLRSIIKGLELGNFTLIRKPKKPSLPKNYTLARTGGNI